MSTRVTNFGQGGGFNPFEQRREKTSVKYIGCNGLKIACMESHNLLYTVFLWWSVIGFSIWVGGTVFSNSTSFSFSRKYSSKAFGISLS